MASVSKKQKPSQTTKQQQHTYLRVHKPTSPDYISPPPVKPTITSKIEDEKEDTIEENYQDQKDQKYLNVNTQQIPSSYISQSSSKSYSTLQIEESSSSDLPLALLSPPNQKLQYNTSTTLSTIETHNSIEFGDEDYMDQIGIDDNDNDNDIQIKGFSTFQRTKDKKKDDDIDQDFSDGDSESQYSDYNDSSNRVGDSKNAKPPMSPEIEQFLKNQLSFTRADSSIASVPITQPHTNDFDELNVDQSEWQHMKTELVLVTDTMKARLKLLKEKMKDELKEKDSDRNQSPSVLSPTSKSSTFSSFDLSTTPLTLSTTPLMLSASPSEIVNRKEQDHQQQVPEQEDIISPPLENDAKDENINNSNISPPLENDVKDENNNNNNNTKQKQKQKERVQHKYINKGKMKGKNNNNINISNKETSNQTNEFKSLGKDKKQEPFSDGDT